MSFDSGEFAWNSVDIRGDDGLFHNGRVIDAVPEGLVVHFGGTGNSGPKLVPFRHIYYRYSCQYSQEYIDEDSNDNDHDHESHEPMPRQGPVDVLLRLQPEDRWKWYPGTLLEDFGLVSVTLPDRQLKGFATQGRIRERHSENYLARARVGQGMFRRDLVVVPSQLDASRASDDELIKVFNAQCRQRDYWIMATHILNNAHHGVFRELAVLGISDEDHESSMDYMSRDDHKFKHTCEESLDELLLSFFNTITSSTTAQCREEGNIRALYRDPCIFPQIFECLTTIQQTKLRAVCRYWDAVLTSATIRRVVTLSLPCYGPNYTSNVYLYASCLYNCWTPQARVLVLYGGSVPGRYGIPLGKTAQLLQRIMTEKGLPAAEMVLLSREWHLDFDDVPNWISAFCEGFVSLAGVCQQVILRNTGFNVKLEAPQFYKPQYFGNKWVASLAVRFSDLGITRQLTANDFWAMIDNQLSDPSAEDLERLTEWMRNGHTSGPHLWEIIQILNKTQILDPRDGIRYRGMWFNAQNLFDVNIRQLTKLTLHAMLQCSQNPDSHNIVIHVR